MSKIGRNDPCACGSGKKYKNCCLKTATPVGKKKFTAKLISTPKSVNLMERTYGHKILEPTEALAPQADLSQEKSALQETPVTDRDTNEHASSENASLENASLENASVENTLSSRNPMSQDPTFI